MVRKIGPKHLWGVVESMPFDLRVVGSKPALAATYWASPSLKVACSASACKLRHSINCCGRKRFRKVHAVRSAIEIDKDNTKQNAGQCPFYIFIISNPITFFDVCASSARSSNITCALDLIHLEDQMETKKSFLV